MEIHVGSYFLLLDRYNCSILSCEPCCHMGWYGWWLFLMIFGTYFLFMDVRLMVMIMRHEEKKKWKRYWLKNKFEE